MSDAVRSGEFFAALSLATDMGTGQPAEHGLRTCLLAIALAELAGLEGDTWEDAYYLGLLHSIGCTADAPVTARAFGDDRAHKAAYTLIDAGRPVEVISYLWRNVYPAATTPQRLRAFAAAMAAGPEFARVNLRSHCEAGEPPGAAAALALARQRGPVVRVRALGREGHARRARRGTNPDRCAGPARRAGRRGVCRRRRRREGPRHGRTVCEHEPGRDPGLAALLHDHARELVEQTGGLDAWESVVAAERRPRTFSGGDLDDACQVIADYADMKSYATLGHSRAVAEIAEAAAWRLALEAAAIAELRSAAWLHDLGRVGVSAAIWEKPGLPASMWSE